MLLWAGGYSDEGVAIKIRGSNALERAKLIARKYGFLKVSQVGTLDEYFFLEGRKVGSTRTKRSANQADMGMESEVEWVEEQRPRLRVKRDLWMTPAPALTTVPLNPGPYSGSVYFNDPLFPDQWYLDDSRKGTGLDINVVDVWKRGITGAGIVVTILDDGVEHNHTDLSRNYDPKASWDINGDDSDPFPRYDPNDENKHGTRCAGEIAAIANNNKCGVGVAFNARIGAVRMLDGHVTDKVEAASLSLNPQYVDIYSASWGPNDDGKTVEGPGILATAAFLNGINKGRRGLGSIYVWASGNGGHHDDDCNCDGYANSIFTVSISSASDDGEVPWYSETCAATLASTLSSGTHTQRRIVTTDLHDTCTYNHTGTSASAPIAAGIIALLLQANGNLTWRDVQHLLVYTSNWAILSKNKDWRVNGVGLHFHQRFGFGIVNTTKLVQVALDRRWRSSPTSYTCSSNNIWEPIEVSPNQEASINIYIDGCKGGQNEVNFLEHLQVTVTVTHNRRGDLVIDVISPLGTKSPLLDTRSEDDSTQGFFNWKMTTVHFWGENPVGAWMVKVRDTGNAGLKNVGLVRTCVLSVRGTKEPTSYHQMHLSDLYSHSYPHSHSAESSSSVPVEQEHPLYKRGAKNLYDNNLGHADPVYPLQGVVHPSNWWWGVNFGWAGNLWWNPYRSAIFPEPRGESVQVFHERSPIDHNRETAAFRNY